MLNRSHFINFIVPITLKWESGYSNRKSDKGGETYRGIRRDLYPDWEGWPIVDKHKPLRNGDIVNDADLKELVPEFYWFNYFVNRHFDKFNASIVAMQCFDFAVVGGFSVRELQNMLNVKFGESLKVDSVLGENTIAAVNRQNPQSLANAIIDLRFAYHRKIEGDNEANKDGWSNRLKFFKHAITVVE